ncbi:hypothetical protein Cgig2_002865 [Carnegiea gigantea]|uniref:PGG domain-containing protein n=1 Tax=Carnegiea gigantea TaxID=171969 RepID=A0A9Q1KPV7_9CARY|nr:hypothetical protein Cgig2_002865 [Carnegiea gigantea]
MDITTYMDLSLLKAAQQGDTDQLKALSEEDPLLLQKFALSNYPDSPAHIAALTNQPYFLREILQKMPSFAWDRNKAGLTPLHIASAMGNIDMVREILEVSGPDLCLMKEKGGLTALHYASIKGRVEVIEELLSECPEVVRGVTAKGETALHLAVVYSQFEALGIMIENLGFEDEEVLYAVDCHGNTIFQLAERMKQLEVLNVLRSQGLIKQDQITHQPEYITEERKQHKGTMSLSIDVSELGNETKYENITAAPFSPLRLDQKEEQQNEPPSQQNKESSSETTTIRGIAKEMIPVLASLVAGVTYNAALNPPNTVWKDNMKLDITCIPQKLSKKPSIDLGESVSKQCPSAVFYAFMGFNTAGFLCAVYLIIARACSIPGAIQYLFPTSMIMLVISYLLALLAMAPDFGSFIVICSLAFVLIIYTFYPFAISRFVAWIKEHNKESAQM